jgi:Ser/Thr protein kinase RdoA (MazF antagonist)
MATLGNTIDHEILSEWKLSRIRSLGGRVNHHWLVHQGDRQVVLRRYSELHTDIEYELTVMRILRDCGWPVPVPLSAPRCSRGVWWCLFSFLPGHPTSVTGDKEQRSRGRLLAELHQATAMINDLGQRDTYGRADSIVGDPALTQAVRAYETHQPDVGGMMRWYIDEAVAQFDALVLHQAEQIVIHSDFAAWNLLYVDGTLSGVLDFESTHLNFRVADFALAWRGHYDAVIEGYEEVHSLSPLDRQLLVPVFWSWLFLGVKQEIEQILSGDREDHRFAWQVKQLQKRSPLFGALETTYPSTTPR